MRRFVFALPIGALAALTGCSTLTPTDDPVYLRIQDMEARLMRIERVVNNESLIQLAGQVEQLRSETQALRGQIETLQYESETGATRQRELYLDIDQRLQALESGRRAQSGQGFDPGAAAGGAIPFGSEFDGAPAAGGDQAAYEAAFGELRATRYAQAADAFRNFLNAYPRSPLAANAQYWLAETQYVQQQYADALTEFQKVVDQYPQSDKAADAMLKIGFSHVELGQTAQARTVLERVVREFPGSSASQHARTRLDTLGRGPG